MKGQPPTSLAEHPTRRRIYEHLCNVPGDHFRSIARGLHLGLGETSHHLQVLVRHGLLRVERVDGRSRFFPIGGHAQEEINGLYLRQWRYRDMRARVLLAVHRLSGARPADVARALGISRQLATYHLTRMVDGGVLRRVAGRYVDGRPVRGRLPR